MAVTESGLADLQGKVMNCGGGGSCGTCIVEVLLCFLIDTMLCSRFLVLPQVEWWLLRLEYLTLKCFELNLSKNDCN